MPRRRPLGDFTVRFSPALSLFAASLIAMAPMHALAQTADAPVSVRDRPRPEYDPMGLRYGGFDLHSGMMSGNVS